MSWLELMSRAEQLFLLVLLTSRAEPSWLSWLTSRTSWAEPSWLGVQPYRLMWRSSPAHWQPPSRWRLSRSGPQVHLLPPVSLLEPSPSLEEKLSPDLPGGGDWASGGPALCRRRAHPPGMPRPPLLFPCAMRDGAPQTLTKLSVFGS